MEQNLSSAAQSTGSICGDQHDRGDAQAKNFDLPKYGSASSSQEKISDEGTIAPGETATKQQIRWSRIQLFSCCFVLFLIGWVDGTTGPLLPRIRERYNIGYALVSVLFVFACVGYICGALLNIYLVGKLRMGQIMLIGASIQALSPALPFTTVTVPPLPLFTLVFFLHGVGGAMQDAQAAGYIASVKRNPETRMGILQACYGLGALAAPLVSTQFSQITDWSYHYLVTIGIAFINFIIIALVFGTRDQDDAFKRIGQPPMEKNASGGLARKILGMKAVHLLSLCILIYIGISVTIGGWIVSFMIEKRGGGPESGYVAVGFHAGVTLSRVLLLPLNKLLGERRAVFVYVILATGLQLIVWLVPSFFTSAILIGVMGLLLGPTYPLTINHAARILPNWAISGSIGWIAGCGQTGSAFVPFITGAFSQRFGIQSLQPILLVMLVLLLSVWAILPQNSLKSPEDDAEVPESKEV